MTADARLAAAAALLAARGLPDASVAAEGPRGEIAAVRLAGGTECDRLLRDGDAGLSDALRALGFHYVALDLA
jgi:hypothetical protein